MDRIRFIEHKGKRIVLCDYSGITDVDEGLREIATARRFIGALPADGTVMTLSDVRDTRYDRRIVDAMKEMAVANRPIVKAAALVSNSPLHQAAINMIAFFSRRKLHVFADRDTALDWLATQ